MCCKLLSIEEGEFLKPANVWCEHSTEHGCGIYERRYPICRTYECAWKLGSFGEQHRPDRSKVVVSLRVKNGKRHWQLNEAYRGAHLKGAGAQIVKALKKIPLAIYVTTAGSERILVMKPRVKPRSDPQA